MTTIRALLLAGGAAAGAYGAVLLLRLGGHNLVETLKWLVGGVVLHDALIGPLVVIVAAVAARLARGKVPAPVTVGALVLASVTLVAVPVLGRFGHRADNTTLLDRSYGIGWFAFAGLTLLVVAVALVRGRLSRPTSDDEGTL